MYKFMRLEEWHTTDPKEFSKDDKLIVLEYMGDDFHDERGLPWIYAWCITAPFGIKEQNEFIDCTQFFYEIPTEKGEVIVNPDLFKDEEFLTAFIEYMGDGFREAQTADGTKTYVLRLREDWLSRVY